jgi:hypothetical protein
MSAYKQQEYDFVFRTREILSQYDEYFKDKDKKKKYEITLMINAFVGLLILPQQEWFDKLPSEIVSRDSWGIDSSHIGFIKSGELKSVKSVTTHLRNSIAHYNFIAFENKDDNISQIHFLDYRDKEKTEKTFEATIPVANLRKFLDKFSLTMIDKIKEAR